MLLEVSTTPYKTMVQAKSLLVICPSNILPSVVACSMSLVHTTELLLFNYIYSSLIFSSFWFASRIYLCYMLFVLVY